MKEDVLPEGWEIKRFEGVIDIQGGSQPPKSEFIYEEQENYIRLLQIRDFGEKPVPTFVPKNRVSKFCQETDILIARYGASLGRIVTGLSGAYNVALAKTIYDKSVLNDRFVFYLLQTPIFQKPLSMISRSAQNGFAKQDIADIKIPLPPLPEQQYLSQKLTALLDEVAQTKQRLEAIPALLKQFRQSVLADAVSGKLTEENFEPENLKKLAETDVIIKTGPFGSALHKEEYISDGIPVINPIHISNGNIIPSSEMSISQDKFSKLSRWQLKKDEVILGRRGEMGRAAVIVENMLPMLCGTGSIVLSSRQILSKYLALILRSPTAVNFFNQSSVGSTMVNLNQKIIKELEVYIPPKKQQTQIVQKVETYFALADEIETQVNAALENVNLLTQSILAKAFSGELSAAWRKENSQLIQIRNNNE